MNRYRYRGYYIYHNQYGHHVQTYMNGKTITLAIRQSDDECKTYIDDMVEKEDKNEV